jgi:FixJ family two-component response regulator
MRGMKNKQIADTLQITTGTVKVHIYRRAGHAQGPFRAGKRRHALPG